MSLQRRVFVISGPSGAGKGTLVTRACSERPFLQTAVSCTTRKPRDGEIDGRHYYFITDDEFLALVDAGEFLETAYVHGHRYGTLKSEVLRIIESGSSVILEIDVQGGMQVKKEIPEAVLIFIEPPSLEDLEKRLRKRKSESEEDIELRMSNAMQEMLLSNSYDAVVINDDVKQATKDLLEIIADFENVDDGKDDLGFEL